jgi:hypothetical protein
MGDDEWQVDMECSCSGNTATTVEQAASSGSCLARRQHASANRSARSAAAATVPTHNHLLDWFPSLVGPALPFTFLVGRSYWMHRDTPSGNKSLGIALRLTSDATSTRLPLMAPGIPEL